MKRVIKAILRRVYYCVIYFIGCWYRLFNKVKKNQILCWSYYGGKYACNPKYITEYLLNNHNGEYQIYWAFTNKDKFSVVPKQVKTCLMDSLRFIKLLNTSQIVITNARTGQKIQSMWKKRRNQRYIMTWHSSMGIKRIEKDVEKELSKSYCDGAKKDSKYCDLIFSGCKFRSEVIKRAFWYDGEILEKGTPRNDILFDKTRSQELKEKIFKQYSIPADAKILLYAPTFRKDHKLHYYKIDWDKVIPRLNEKFNGNFYILLRLHPNMTKITGMDELLSFDKVIDVTSYNDIQELLCVSDIEITDYSSSIYDMALTYKPCFIYATDYQTYDRGTYLSLDSLPFASSINTDELVTCIDNFDYDTYKANLSSFINDTLVSFENGNACKEFYLWMQRQVFSV
ncbi:MAG: CDP-glycerol glycerophosphotransferase family protein [Bacteroidota bacterium]|nr:CDP-glycerol glycerophosphotransferase family protein [Bacteroidota bacterium]